MTEKRPPQVMTETNPPWRTQPCPHCRKTERAHERLAEFGGGCRNQAKPGDICMCTDCGAVWGISEELNLTAMNDEQVDRLLGNESMLDRQAYYRDRCEAEGKDPVGLGRHVRARIEARKIARAPVTEEQQAFALADELKALVKARVAGAAEIVCPREKSFMTPCIARDGHLAVCFTFTHCPICVGCEQGVVHLLATERAKHGQPDVKGTG